ncbi:MAG: DUF3866 family protein, partial [Actinobacteria bacterium]|nr:DUF3866 family protein [Actinomycetota bacterium]
SGSTTTGVAHADDSGGHIIKLRYTPLQHDVLAAEEPASPHHPIMASATDVGGMPVACCGLHSQVPLVAAAIKAADPTLRICYVMTDQAALPLALSKVMDASVSAGLIDATVTCGQAFGGGVESVNLYSALLAARHVCSADIAIVGIGPGVVGTATPFGHGGVAQGEAINAVAVLKGRPVAVLRLSFADKRERHRGVSHHTLTALSAVALARAVVPVPALPEDESARVEDALVRAGVWDRHVRYDARGSAEVPMHGVEVRSMGRGIEDDPTFFLAAFAAGAACADFVIGKGVDATTFA